MSMEPLSTALLDLAAELPRLPVPLLVGGGGFGPYLRQRHLEDADTADTMFPADLRPPSRSIEDVDLIRPTAINGRSRPRR